MQNPTQLLRSVDISIWIVLFISFSFTKSLFAQTSLLFDSEEPIELVLNGDIKTILNDRGDDSENHRGSLSYLQGEVDFKIPIKIKTRGHFRKMSSNCKYPPLYLNFKESSTPKESIFSKQDKLKLVMPCQGEDYVINEYLVYKLYNLISPKGFKARLVKVTLNDTVKNKSTDPFLGFIIEEEEQMALRNHSIIRELQGLSPESTDKEDFLTMAIFQYMIGNTDWSVQFQQNIKLIAVDSSSLPTAVPYDFDHAGIVRAPYAHPAPELKMSSTLHRRYRGYCIPDITQYQDAFDFFNGLKEKFYSIYNDNEMLSSSYKKQTIKFLDEFYETINDTNKAQKAFLYPCNKSGTGNVVIKGLKDHKN